MSQQTLDYRQHLVLFVDDEAKTRKYFDKLFGKTFRIILAEDGVVGLQRFREYQDEIGLVVTDQRMPNESGTDFLEKVALEPELMQDDGIHPTADAQPLLLETLWEQLEPLLGTGG